MVDRKSEYAPTNQEYWENQYNGPEGVEDKAREAHQRAEDLVSVIYDEEVSSSVSEDFDRDPRVVSAERHAGVTMDRPGNNPSHYDQNQEDERPAHKEPHTEGPGYDEWANGFDDDEAMEAFSGLFEDGGEGTLEGHTQSEGDRAFGKGYDVGLQN